MTTPIPTSLTLTLEQYTALVSIARQAPGDQLQLEAFLIDIEKANGIIRYSLWVQWQELNNPVQPTAQFPTQWPPDLRSLIQTVNAPISRTDVLNRLAVKAVNPTNILVTVDPAATVGWTPLDVMFPPPP